MMLVKKDSNLNLVDIGGGFPVPYDTQVPEFKVLASLLNSEFKRLFPDDIEILAEPGRFIVATAATLVSEIIGKARRDGKIFYHINDGVYHTFSGVVYDHWIPNFSTFKVGEQEICAVVGPTCDSLIRSRYRLNFLQIWKSEIFSSQKILERTVLHRQPSLTDLTEQKLFTRICDCRSIGNRNPSEYSSKQSDMYL